MDSFGNVSGQREASLQEFFQSNCFIEIEHAARLGYNRPRDVARALPEAILLDSSFVSRDLVSRVGETIQDSLRKGSWLDVFDLVPTCFTMEDTASLLNKCEADRSFLGSKKGTVVASTCIVSSTFMKALSRRCISEARLLAYEAIRGAPVSRDDSEIVVAPPSANGSGSLRAAKAEAMADIARRGSADDYRSAAEGLADEMFDMHLRPAKGSKRGKDSKRVQKVFSSKKPPAPATPERRESLVFAEPSLRHLRKRIAEWYPDTDTPAGDCDDLAEALAREFLRAAVDAFKAAMEAWENGDSDLEPRGGRLVEIAGPDGKAMLVEMAA